MVVIMTTIGPWSNGIIQGIEQLPSRFPGGPSMTGMFGYLAAARLHRHPAHRLLPSQRYLLTRPRPHLQVVYRELDEMPCAALLRLPPEIAMRILHRGGSLPLLVHLDRTLRNFQIRGSTVSSPLLRLRINTMPRNQTDSTISSQFRPILSTRAQTTGLSHVPRVAIVLSKSGYTNPIAIITNMELAFTVIAKTSFITFLDSDLSHSAVRSVSSTAYDQTSGVPKHR
jgi:hypothetical protein